MDWFNFSKVAIVMEALNWEWFDVEGVPEEPNIREYARSLMKQAYSYREDISCGGFTVQLFEDDDIRLSFCVDEWTTGE